MNDKPIGRFWAVGVGPGDPELLTLKALRIVRSVSVVYHAGPEPTRGRAFEIVQSHLRAEQECRVVLTEPMNVVGAGDARTHYRAAVEHIAADCRSGIDVAFITEGDPTVYSTAACIWQLHAELNPDIPVEIVPGVSSITAAAARVGWPLAQRGEPFAVVPASYHVDDLHRWIEAFPMLCLLKPGEALPRLADLLRDLEPQREVVYVEEVGSEREWITHDLAEALGRQHYFALALVRTREKATPIRRASAGKLCVIGLGPGDPGLLTPRALEALRSADVIVGYEAYLRPLASLGLRAELRASPIGAETERARQALELAKPGQRVALVSSGDAGVYGMASLLLEMAERSPEIEIEVVPGVTAATAAAALLGAPLGHDFACISLSDLLTPWDAIERRLEAAALGDFVLALYNPISRRRTWQLPRAREILLTKRKPETPVGMVDKAYRPGASVRLTTLGELTTDGVGMETVVIIGNSQTCVTNGKMVTPRGYPNGSTSRERPRPEEYPPVADAPGSPALAVGRRILDESFAVIEHELGQHDLPPWAFAVARRMIHASADFDFARLLHWSVDFEAAVSAALRDRVPVVTDTEMVLLGIRTALGRVPGVTLACHLNDAESRPLVEATGLTRSAAGIRLAARRYSMPVLVIGNAPTALDEALRLAGEEGWRPAAIIGMPVGFVGVDEAKERLLAQGEVPYLTCVGRKGGSAVASAAVNALIDWFSDRA